MALLAPAPSQFMGPPTLQIIYQIKKESTVHSQTNRPANKQYRKIPCYEDVHYPPNMYPEKFTVTPVLDSLQRK